MFYICPLLSSSPRLLTVLPGQSNLPSSCPVCEHSPLSAEDCHPNKSLRTTIKVFLRTAEKKREAQRAKEAKESAPTTPIGAPKPQIPSSEQAAPEASVVKAPNGEAQPSEQQDPAPKEESENALARPADSVCDCRLFFDEIHPESCTNSSSFTQTEQAADPETAEQANKNNSALVAQTDEEKQGQENDGPNDQEATQEGEGEGEGEQGNGEDQQNFNADAMNGGFPNMSFGQGGGDYNQQMQMMMAMQNGMGSNFNMMGTCELQGLAPSPDLRMSNANMISFSQACQEWAWTP
jgi:hypothetical protein